MKYQITTKTGKQVSHLRFNSISEAIKEVNLRIEYWSNCIISNDLGSCPRYWTWKSAIISEVEVFKDRFCDSDIVRLIESKRGFSGNLTNILTNHDNTIKQCQVNRYLDRKRRNKSLILQHV